MAVLQIMDVIFFGGLCVETIVGIYDWERQVKQPVILDIEMATDIAKAAASDQVSDALDYKAVAKRVIEFVENSEYQLVETLAENIARVIREEFPVSWLKLKLNKQGAIRGARDVGVIIERGQKTKQS